MNAKVKDFLVKYTMVLVLLIVFVLFNQMTGGKMIYAQNLSNLLLQNAYVVILACGMLLCILTGGNIDLSVGSVVCLVGAIAAKLLSTTSIPAIGVILLGLVVAAVIGVWQGYWIGYSRIPPFITTLAGMFVFRGLGRVVLDSKTISIQNRSFLDVFTSYINVPGLDDGQKYSAIIVGVVVVVGYIAFTIIGRQKKQKKGYHVESALGTYIKMAVISVCVLLYCYKLSQYKGIPVMLLWLLAVVVLYAFITSKTALGRHFYAIGGNEESSVLSGINADRVKISAYAISFPSSIQSLTCSKIKSMSFLVSVSEISNFLRYSLNFSADAIAVIFAYSTFSFSSIFLHLSFSDYSILYPTFRTVFILFRSLPIFCRNVFICISTVLDSP